MAWGLGNQEIDYDGDTIIKVERLLFLNQRGTESGVQELEDEGNPINGQCIASINIEDYKVKLVLLSSHYHKLWYLGCYLSGKDAHHTTLLLQTAHTTPILYQV